MPTASAVVADLIDLAVGRASGRSRRCGCGPPSARGFALRPRQAVRSRFYLRLLVADRPGVLADVARRAGRPRISIASVIQHEALDEARGRSRAAGHHDAHAETGRFRKAVRASMR